MDPRELLANHEATGEPLDEYEVADIVQAGIATWYDFVSEGGGLYHYSPSIDKGYVWLPHRLS